MDSIRFILDGEVIEIDSVEPTRTLLQYLREDLRRVGSKEGCARAIAAPVPWSWRNSTARPCVIAR